ncbi:MAG: hypothetical protein KDD66_01660 [Bdellovibrionales bacterium]|nr:hypothetical protein [Bdellovibrionales bacterium]
MQQSWNTEFDKGRFQHAVDYLASPMSALLPARSVIEIGVLLMLFQAMDGVLTTIGINRFGLAAEGNPVLRQLMVEFGHIPTLTILKSTAIIIVLALTLIAARLPWVKNAMSALTCLYFFTAIVPWTYILFIKPFFLIG